MKFIVRISLILLVCLTLTPVQAQRKGTKAKPQTKAAAVPQTICLGEAVPKGFVIVEAKRSSKCVELTVKKPAATETVCDGSPIPVGYSVVSQSSSPRCYDASANPLTNALVLSSGDVPTPQSRKTTARESDDDDEEAEAPIRITGGGNEQSERPKSVLEQRAEEARRQARIADVPLGPSQAEIDLAVRRSTVVLGMKPQDVMRAWGSSHTNDNLYEDGLQITIWRYRRGEVYFRNGIVYRVMLLKN